MKSYMIEIEVDGEYRKSSWNGYDEKQAIAQAFLSYGYDGARELKVISIKN